MHSTSTQLFGDFSLVRFGRVGALVLGLFLAGSSLMAQLSVTANDTTICLGDSATLTATGGTQYDWDNPLNANTNTGAVIKVAPSNVLSPTVYTVIDPINDDTASITITVVALPTVNISTTADAEGRFICVDSSVTMSAFTTNGVFSWSPAATLNTATGPSVVASPLTNTTYTVMFTDSVTGCSDARDITISVNSQIPSIGVLFSGPSTVCERDSVTMEASGASNGYTWIGPNLSSTTGQVVQAAPNSTTDYIVVGRSLGCTGRDTLTVNVLPAPTLSASVTPPGSICLDEEKVVTVTGSPVDFYTWKFPTQSLTTTNNSVTVSPNVPGVITIAVTAVDSNDCSSTETVNIVVDSCYVGPVPGIVEAGLEIRFKPTCKQIKTAWW